jgi:hypothetical protein
MRFFNKLLIILPVLLTLVLASGATASEATAQLSATINEFVKILVNTP